MALNPILLPFVLFVSPSYCFGLTNITQGTQDATDDFVSQWANPTNVVPVFFIIGGEVVRTAVAQLSGGYFVPVTFSFGWVAFSFNALVAIFGDGRIMPPTDCPSIVINTKSGHDRINRSWVLGRILRDFEQPCTSALNVTVFHAMSGSAPRDWIWCGGILTMVIQCLISAIPYIHHGNWVVPMITMVGTFLALCEGALPQWRSEKWAARPNSKKTVAVTRGNGNRHVMVIISEGEICDLEDLAGGQVPHLRLTRWVRIIFSLSQFILLITIAGLKQDVWYLMAVGGIGLAQNFIAASASRTPESHGIRLEQLHEFTGPKVMKVLQNVEVMYPGVGASLLRIFFPGPLRNDEIIWWNSRTMGQTRPRRLST